MDELNKKYEKLVEVLKGYKTIVIGYSGGVDSTFLALCASKVLGDNAKCVTLVGDIHSKSEIEESKEYVKSMGISQQIVPIDVLQYDFIVDNPKDRCYHCKTKVFTTIKEICKEIGFNEVCDGTNVDDLGDYRPGLVALKELGIKSPLVEAGLTKQDIRELSKREGLKTWNKPSFACLASRVPYNEKITKEKLDMIEKSEEFLFSKGFCQLRVRHHGDIARIEINTTEREKLFNIDLLDEISEKLKSFGFTYVTFEASGYKMGNLN